MTVTETGYAGSYGFVCLYGSPQANDTTRIAAPVSAMGRLATPEGRVVRTSAARAVGLTGIRT